MFLKLIILYLVIGLIIDLIMTLLLISLFKMSKQDKNLFVKDTKFTIEHLEELLTKSKSNFTLFHITTIFFWPLIFIKQINNGKHK